MLRILVLAGLCWWVMFFPATAQESVSEGGLYLIANATAGKPNSPRAEGVYEADLGLELGMQVGAGFAYSGLRLEAQVGYETFYLDSVDDEGGAVLSGVNASGKAAGPMAMLNLSYQPGEPGTFRPFLGVGIGIATLKTEFEGQFCSVPLGSCFTDSSIVGGTDTVAAWQWSIGMSKLMSQGKGEFYVGYRYLGTQDIDVNVTGYGAVTQDGVESHSLLLGWRWFFGARQ